jgi:hypothetical protein
MAGGHKSGGFKTERGRLTIVNAAVSNGATSFTPTLPGELESDWRALLEGLNQRIQPADRLEEEMVFNLAMALWQARRLHRYEKAVTRQQIEEASSDVLFDDRDAMALLLARGVESVKAELSVMEKAFALIGSVALAGDDEPLSKEDGELVLQLAARLVLKGKSVEQAFNGLPEDGWSWATARENLNALCEAAGKSLPWLLKTLHAEVMEELAGLRKTLEDGVRSIEANYALKDGETERLLLYHSRVQNRIAKWLSLLAQSKADRLGLTITQPLEGNGENGVDLLSLASPAGGFSVQIQSFGNQA